jgi:ribosomal-protein-alanine acetyltransferase
MDYRQAIKDDIPSIDCINRHFLPENYDKKTYEVHIELTPTLNWVAVSDDQIIGYIITHIQDRVEAHITSIAVDENHRRKGVGKMLIVKMLIEAKKKKLLSCSLHVRVSNAAAIGLYEGLKFNKVRIKKGYYEDGEDAYFMRRRL